MSLLLDAGALIAIEREDRTIAALLKQELLAGRIPITHAGVLGQVWRGGMGRQASLARIVPALNIASLDTKLGQRAGMLLARSRMNDVIDAALVQLALDGDLILTSDAPDLARLAAAADLHIDIIPV